MEGLAGQWRIGILGPVELRGPVHLGSAMERCLLAALAVHRGEAVSAESLVDALWGGDPPRTAAKTLQNYVLRVRRAMAGMAGLSIVTQAASPAGAGAGNGSTSWARSMR
jgi:DNA-binding SARP family transcriptional activator